MGHLLKVIFAGLALISAIRAQEPDKPTLFPSTPFYPESDAQKLYDAIIGLGTNEQSINDVLCHRVFSQRGNITLTYRSKFGRNLANDLKGDLSGSYQSLAVMMTYDYVEFVVSQLHGMMAGVTDEAALTEMLMVQRNDQLAAIRPKYAEIYGHSLSSDIDADTTGNFNKLLNNMAAGSRNESNTTDPNQVASDVDRLYAASEGMTGSDESVFVTVFSLRSWAHLNNVSNAYYSKYRHTLDSVILSEFTGAIRDAFSAIIKYATNKNSFFAERFFYAISGVGTDDLNLIRLVVGRCEVDLGNIKSAYEAKYGHTLAYDIQNDTSGWYRNALLTLVG